MMMGRVTPRNGILDMHRPTQLSNLGSWFPFGNDQSSTQEGVTFPETVQTDSAQLVFEVTAVSTNSQRGRLRVWKNSNANALYTTADLFLGSTGWRRAIDTSAASEGNRIFLGEDESGGPDKVIGKMDLYNSNSSGVIKWITCTIHYHYVLPDVAAFGSMAVMRPRWLVLAGSNIQQVDSSSVLPFGGTFSSVSEGTSMPTSIRWRSGQVVTWVQTVGAGAGDKLEWNTYKNANDGSGEIFKTEVDIGSTTAAGMRRDYSTTVVDSGSDEFIGEDSASTADELLSNMAQTASGGAKTRDTVYCVHGEFLP